MRSSSASSASAGCTCDKRRDDGPGQHALVLFCRPASRRPAAAVGRRVHDQVAKDEHEIVVARPRRAMPSPARARACARTAKLWLPQRAAERRHGRLAPFEPGQQIDRDRARVVGRPVVDDVCQAGHESVDVARPRRLQSSSSRSAVGIVAVRRRAQSRRGGPPSPDARAASPPRRAPRARAGGASSSLSGAREAQEPHGLRRMPSIPTSATPRRSARASRRLVGARARLVLAERPGLGDRQGEARGTPRAPSRAIARPRVRGRRGRHLGAPAGARLLAASPPAASRSAMPGAVAGPNEAPREVLRTRRVDLVAALHGPMDW